MKISESQKTHHEIICIHWQGIDDEVHEKWVDIHKDSDGDLMSVSIGSEKLEEGKCNRYVNLKFCKKNGKVVVEDNEDWEKGVGLK